MQYKNDPDAWKKVKKKGRKLTGFLTDTLIANIFNFGDRMRGSGSNAISDVVRVSRGKIPKKLPSKFK